MTRKTEMMGDGRKNLRSVQTFKACLRGQGCKHSPKFVRTGTSEERLLNQAEAFPNSSVVISPQLRLSQETDGGNEAGRRVDAVIPLDVLQVHALPVLLRSVFGTNGCGPR